MTRSTPPIWEMSEEMLFVRLIRKVIGMDNKQLGRRWLIATSAIITMIAAANASGPQQDQSNIPHDVTKAATPSHATCCTDDRSPRPGVERLRARIQLLVTVRQIDLLCAIDQWSIRIAGDATCHHVSDRRALAPRVSRLARCDCESRATGHASHYQRGVTANLRQQNHDACLGDPAGNRRCAVSLHHKCDDRRCVERR